MSRSAEKSDVDIAQLFRYTKEVDVQDFLTGQSGKVYMRLVGDADLAKARVFGLRKAGYLRRELRTPDSDMRLAFINELPEFQDKETLIGAVQIMSMGETQRVATQRVNLPEPKAPHTEAPLEELENYQKAVDEYPAKFEAALLKEMEKIRKSEAKKLAKLSESELYNLYESLVIDQICSSELSTNFYHMCVFLSIYVDDKFKKRLFNSFEEFDNIASQLKEKFLTEYRTLELGMDELKKLPEATE
jgi:hypothetical protein